MEATVHLTKGLNNTGWVGTVAVKQTILPSDTEVEIAFDGSSYVRLTKVEAIQDIFTKLQGFDYCKDSVSFLDTKIESPKMLKSMLAEYNPNF